jgi:hypothetical protein
MPSAQTCSDTVHEMAKYYVQSANLRLVLDAGTARDAAMRAVQRSHGRQAERATVPMYLSVCCESWQESATMPKRASTIISS